MSPRGVFFKHMDPSPLACPRKPLKEKAHTHTRISMKGWEGWRRMEQRTDGEKWRGAGEKRSEGGMLVIRKSKAS